MMARSRRIGIGIISCWKRNIKRSVYLIAIFTLVYYAWWRVDESPQDEAVTGCGISQNRVYMLTIPGSGADLVGKVIWRYAIRHDLTAILFTSGNQHETTPKKGDFFPPYHTAITELIYNPTILYRYIRMDTPYITVLRHPLSHLQSILQDAKNADGTAAGISIKDFLENPERFEKVWTKPISLTNNPYARFFGMQPEQFHNASKVEDLIASTDKDFSTVLILEKLDESLIMFRRVMCWSFKDIIYDLDHKPEVLPDVTQDEDIIKKHRAWAEADYAIYEHFRDKLENYTTTEGTRFLEELSEFKQLSLKVNSFCSHVLHKDESLAVSSTAGNFTFSLTDCEHLQANTVHLRNILQEKLAQPAEKEYI